MFVDLGENVWPQESEDRIQLLERLVVILLTKVAALERRLVPSPVPDPDKAA